jgi:hypothetical protein
MSGTRHGNSYNGRPRRVVVTLSVELTPSVYREFSSFFVSHGGDSIATFKGVDTQGDRFSIPCGVRASVVTMRAARKPRTQWKDDPGLGRRRDRARFWVAEHEDAASSGATEETAETKEAGATEGVAVTATEGVATAGAPEETAATGSTETEDVTGSETTALEWTSDTGVLGTAVITEDEGGTTVEIELPFGEVPAFKPTLGDACPELAHVVVVGCCGEEVVSPTTDDDQACESGVVVGEGECLPPTQPLVLYTVDADRDPVAVG